MKSPVTARFIDCVQHLKDENVIRSVRQFALSLDYLPQSLSEIMRGRRDVTIELLRLAIDKYDLNPYFLYKGELPIRNNPSGGTRLKLLTVVTDGIGRERITYVSRKAYAGYAEQCWDPEFMEELPSFYLPGYEDGSYRMFEVKGDSMEPTIHQGDQVIGDFMDPSYWMNSIKNNYVYVIVTQGSILVKRVKNRIRDEQMIIATSDNTYYDPLDIPIEDVKELWQVSSLVKPFQHSALRTVHAHDEMMDLKKSLARQTHVISALQDTIQNMVRRS